MKKIAIYGQYLHDGSLATVRSVVEELQAHYCQVAIESEFHKLFEDLSFSKPFAVFEQLDQTHFSYRFERQS